MFDLGPLEACFSNVAGRLARAVELNERASLPLETLRMKLNAAVSNEQKSAKAQSQAGARLPKGQNRRALGRSDKESKTAGSRPSRSEASGPERD